MASNSIKSLMNAEVQLDLNHRQIWILEDDSIARKLYQETLGKTYQLRIFDRLKEFWACWHAETDPRPLIVIADLMLPDGNFISILEENPWPYPKVPLIVVSSRLSLEEMRRCFQLGARDYLTKPVAPSELFVKVEKLATHSRHSAPNPIDFTTNTLAGPYGTTTLTAKEMQIMVALFNSDEHAMRKPQLANKIWRGVRVGSRTLDVHICHLRRKLKSTGYDIKLEKPDLLRVVEQKNAYVSPKVPTFSTQRPQSSEVK